MNDWLHLTDRYGGAMCIRRERVVLAYGDSVIQGDGERQFTIHGTTIIMQDRDNYFVTDAPDDVISQLGLPE